MAILPIRLFPDPVLRQTSLPIMTGFNRQCRKLAANLKETLYSQPMGIGIAAPQVGIAKRLILVDVSPRDTRKGLLVMVNPHIHSQKGEILTREGCMSLPDYRANLRRFSEITVYYTELDGKTRSMKTDGVEAVCIQHEIDHLEGILIHDRVGCLMSDLIPRNR